MKHDLAKTFRQRLSQLPDFWVVIFLVLMSTILFYRLGQGTLRDWDEAIYGQVSKEMVQSGNWLTPHWAYQYYFLKPPLFEWTTAFFYLLFGINEFWARAGSVCSGIGLIVVTYLIGRFLFGRTIGCLSAVILLSSYGFVSQARFGTLDIMLTLFIYLALYAYLHVRAGHEKWWYGLWVSCALALLTKGMAGMVAPITITIALLMDRNWSGSFRSKHFWQGFLLSLLVVAPWHILMSVWYGPLFVNEYFGHQIIGRATTSLEGHQGSRTYYLETLWWQMSSWVCLLPFALAFSLKENIKGDSRSRILLLIVAVMFTLYTLVQTKLFWYILPIYPALAVLTAAFLVHAYTDRTSISFSGLLMAALLLLFFAPLKVALLFGFAGILLFLLMRRLACPQTAVLAGVFFLIVALNALRPLYHITNEPIAELARVAASSSANDRRPLVIFDSSGRGFHIPTPLFYSGRPALDATTEEEVSQYIKRDHPQGIIFPKKYLTSLSSHFQLNVQAEAGTPASEALVYATFESDARSRNSLRQLLRACRESHLILLRSMAIMTMWIHASLLLGFCS